MYRSSYPMISMECDSSICKWEVHCSSWWWAWNVIPPFGFSVFPSSYPNLIPSIWEDIWHCNLKFGDHFNTLNPLKSSNNYQHAIKSICKKTLMPLFEQHLVGPAILFLRNSTPFDKNKEIVLPPFHIYTAAPPHDSSLFFRPSLSALTALIPLISFQWSIESL